MGSRASAGALLGSRAATFGSDAPVLRPSGSIGRSGDDDALLDDMHASCACEDLQKIAASKKASCLNAQISGGHAGRALRLRGGGLVELVLNLPTSSPRSLRLAWLPSDGRPAVPYGALLQPGQQLRQSTHEGHRWALYDESFQQQVVLLPAITSSALQSFDISDPSPNVPAPPAPATPAQAQEGSRGGTMRVSMQDVAPPALGKLYAVASGPHFGVHASWNVEFQRERYDKIEFNPQSGRPDRRMSGTQARCQALAWLLNNTSGDEHAAIHAVLQREQQQSAQAAAAEAEQRAETEAQQRADAEAVRRAQQEARDREVAAAVAEQRAQEQREREAAEQVEAERAAGRAAADSLAARMRPVWMCSALEGMVAACQAAKAAAAKAARERTAEEARVAREQMAAEADARERAITSASEVVTAAAIAAVLAQYPRRDRPKGARSAKAKRRRFAKLDAKQAARAHSSGGADADARADAAEREAAELRHKLAASEARVKLARNRTKRDVSSAGKRALQAVRSQAKASKRKAIAAREWKAAGAARKEARLEHAGTRPAGEPVHSSDRKRRRLLEESMRHLQGKGSGGAGGGGSGGGNSGKGGGKGGGKGKGRGGRGSGGRGGRGWGWGRQPGAC